MTVDDFLPKPSEKLMQQIVSMQRRIQIMRLRHEAMREECERESQRVPYDKEKMRALRGESWCYGQDISRLGDRLRGKEKEALLEERLRLEILLRHRTNEQIVGCGNFFALLLGAGKNRTIIEGYRQWSRDGSWEDRISSPRKVKQTVRGWLTDAKEVWREVHEVQAPDAEAKPEAQSNSLEDRGGAERRRRGRAHVPHQGTSDSGGPGAASERELPASRHRESAYSDDEAASGLGVPPKRRRVGRS